MFYFRESYILFLFAATRNFQKFSSDDGNESLQYNPPLPPSLDSTYKDP